MNRATMGTGIVVLAAAALAACATGGTRSASMRTMSTDEAIAARQQAMKDQGAAWRRIQDNAKAGQLQAIPADADKLAQTAKDIPGLFPKGSVDPNTSRAKPEIWERWPEFEAAAKTLETRATQLGKVARAGDAQATNTAIAEFGKIACGSCHTPFRGPEIKK